jgi:hypothetical protein
MLLTLFLTACSSTRRFSCRYDEVASVLKDRFVENYDEFQQTKPEVNEKTGGLRIYFESPVDFFYGVRVTLGAEKVDDDTTSVFTRIMEDHRTFWGYSGRNKELEKSFLDIIGKRLSGGAWDRMPWRLKSKSGK